MGGNKIECTGNKASCNLHSVRSVLFLKLLIDMMNAFNLIPTLDSVKHELLHNNALARLHNFGLSISSCVI